MASKLARGEAPWFTAAEMAAQPAINGVHSKDGNYEAVHFWMYSALAVPALWLTAFVGLGPSTAFLCTNLLLFGIALVAAFRQGRSNHVLVLVILSPGIWWLNKAHIETFTYSLLLVMVFTLRTQPGIGALAAGLASTQNPPIAALIPLMVLLLPEARSRSAIPWLGAATGLAVLHPIYYLWRLGRWTALVESDFRIPPASRLTSFVVDLNVGLVPNAPFFVVACAVGCACLLQARSLRRSETIFATVAGGWFLFSFSQAININHGGTPSMTRYALWLMPLMLLLCSSPKGCEVVRTPRAAGLFSAAVLLSALWSVIYFRPSVPENALSPTRLAMFQWTRYPSFQNPVPEIFAERLRHSDGVNPVASTPGCEKALLQGGRWPHPCPPSEIPVWCAEEEMLCYANRTSSGYQFVRVPRRGGYRLTWP